MNLQIRLHMYNRILASLEILVLYAPPKQWNNYARLGRCINNDILDRCLSLRYDDLFGIGGHLQELDESRFDETIEGSAKSNS